MILTPAQIREIQGIVGGRVLTHAALSRFTSFKIGGPADLVAEPTDVARLAELLRYLDDEKLPRIVLGAGTNVLFQDEGFPGVVVRTGPITGLHAQGNGSGHGRITVAAGVSLPSVVSQVCKLGWTGLEDLWGIPGSFGGAVKTNAGAGTTSMAEKLIEITLLSARGEETTMSKEDLRYGYRFLQLPRGAVVVRGTLRLDVCSAESIEGRLQEARSRRRGQQPLNRPSAGCIFKNPSTENPAGAIIDRLGCKGMSVGDAQVSEIHANFIVNRGNARASDVLELIEKVRTLVREKEHAELALEIRVIGEGTEDD